MAAAWFEWHTREPRVWNSANRKKKSELRYIVAFMKLSLINGFWLQECAADFKDRVLKNGRIAEQNVLDYLRGCGINVKEAGSVLREMRQIDR